MKGATVARRAKADGWKVTTTDHGRVITISAIHRDHTSLKPGEIVYAGDKHYGCGFGIRIRVTCDSDGNVEQMDVAEWEITTVGDHEANTSDNIAAMVLGKLDDNRHYLPAANRQGQVTA